MILELEAVFNNEGSSIPFDYELSLADISVSGFCPIEKNVKVSGRVKNNAGIVSLTATAELTYTAPCDRCAEVISKNYSIPVNHDLIATLNNEDNDDYIVVSDMRLDLDELVREDVNLALPTKFLCKEDCKGICAMCGKNLNVDQCDCKKPIDPRLEGLLQFLE